jgi:2TM domain
VEVDAARRCGVSERNGVQDAAPMAPVDPARAAARGRIEKRRNLVGGVVAYVVVNAALVGVWAVSGRGYFWPGWVLALWGAGMVLGLWDYVRKPISEADVDAELRRGGRSDLHAHDGT